MDKEKIVKLLKEKDKLNKLTGISDELIYGLYDKYRKSINESRPHDRFIEEHWRLILNHIFNNKYGEDENKQPSEAYKKTHQTIITSTSKTNETKSNKSDKAFVDVMINDQRAEGSEPITQGKITPFVSKVVVEAIKPLTNKAPATIPEKKVREHNLPNGMENLLYEQKLPIPLNANVSIAGMDETFGLKFDMKTFKLTGIPIKRGNFTIEISYKNLEESDKFKFTINPDPKNLWIPKPQPEEKDSYCWKENFDSDNQKLGISRTVISASNRGRSHAQEGKFREDHFRNLIYNIKEGNILVSFSLVADGAGSAKYSRAGSKIVCDSMIDFFSSNIVPIIGSTNNFKFQKNFEYEKIKEVYLAYIKNALSAVHEKIKLEAKNKKVDSKEFASTCLFLLSVQFPKLSKNCLVVSFWIGDGAICIFDKKNKTIKLLGKPDSGEYSGETRFITSNEIFKDAQSIANRIQVEIIDPDDTVIFLMTDGVSDPKFETDANLNDYSKWDSLWSELKKEGIFDSPDPEQALLKWLDFWSLGNHDDRTITVMY